MIIFIMIIFIIMFKSEEEAESSAQGENDLSGSRLSSNDPGLREANIH